MDRNVFIKNIGRVFFLGAFASATAYLGMNGRISPPGNCEKNQYCEKCGSFLKCNLPRAIEQRNYGKPKII